MQAYISLMVFQQVRVLPRFQQALFVLVLLILGKILAATILGAIGRFPAASFWWSLPTSVVAWPFLCALLRRWRKKPLIHA
jgi:cell shape-determining protein MreD